MGREIRVTVDDDEVFERMRTRKRELDLSWREVLHRGLWASPGGPGGTEGQTARGSREDDFGDRLERQIRQRVQDSLQSALGTDPASDPVSASPEPGGESYESDVETLQKAEDAVLRFPFLEESDDPQFQVPLRVNLETGADGLDIDVVAVRQGKTVGEMNAFDRSARMGIAQGFSRGGRAVLELGDGVEQYRVAVALTWSRDDQGQPTVADATVEEVVFDDQQ